MNGRVADMIVITLGAALMQSRQSCAGCKATHSQVILRCYPKQRQLGKHTVV
jgi:hypothetical protein